MRARRRRIGVGAMLLVVALPVLPLAASGPRVQLRSEQRLSPLFAQGIARARRGWIVSGTNALGRVDDELATTKTLAPAIPPDWKAKGYNHVGDVDVVGRYVYAPFEQPDYDLARQATARYDAKTLAFVDAVELVQHENSFVTVDPHTMTAYSMDRFGGDRLVRYDVRREWKPLAPLVMDRSLERVQGGDVAAGAVWMSTDDARHEIYRVDLASGKVDELGSTGHAGGEGEGIDATPVGSARLHAQTVDARLVPVWVDHFAVVGPLDQASDASSGGGGTSDWPPVLVLAAVVLGAAAIAAIFVVFRRARAVADDSRPRT